MMLARGADTGIGGMSPRRQELHLLLKGTRTAMSFVAEARRLARAQPYPPAGQPEYSAMADVLSRAVLFANWEVVGAAALVRAGSVTRIVEMGLVAPYRSDEFMRRLTWRLVADAAHELTETPVIEDATGAPLDISEFVARRRANRMQDIAARPTPIGPILIAPGSVATPRRPDPSAPAASAAPARRRAEMPRAPRGVSA